MRRPPHGVALREAPRTAIDAPSAVETWSVRRRHRSARTSLGRRLTRASLATRDGTPAAVQAQGPEAPPGSSIQLVGRAAGRTKDHGPHIARLHRPIGRRWEVEWPAAYDEMYDSGSVVRAHYGEFERWLGEQTPESMRFKRAEADLVFRRVGITFAVYGDDAGTERLIPFDVVPRILPAGEWRQLEAGLKQRVRALNRFIHDVYHEQDIVRAGRIPAEQVLRNSQYRPEMHGVDVPGGIYSHISGIDVVRAGQGEFYVLEDNLRVPSGVSYMLENRKMMMRLFPDLFARNRVAPVAHYPDLLLDNLRAVAPTGVDDPTVVLLTPGMYNSRLLRARVPRPADGHRARRGPGPVRAGQQRLHAHHARTAARGHHLPAHRRRLHGSAGVPRRLAARRAGAAVGVSRRAGDARQRDRHRHRRRQVDLPVRAGHDRVLPRREADPGERADLQMPRSRGPRATRWRTSTNWW